MNITDYKIDSSRLRRYTGGCDELFAELVTEAVEKFLQMGDPSPGGLGGVYMPNIQTIEFLVDCKVLVQKE
jgi:hypothetical protein